MAEDGLPPRWSIAPYFIVDDVVATANDYRNKLGFRCERFWNDPPSFCMVRRNNVIIMLAQLDQPGLKRPNHTAVATSTSRTATDIDSASVMTLGSGWMRGEHHDR